MSYRKGLAALAACATLACAGMVQAQQREQSGNLLNLDAKPIFAQASAPRKPLMSALDRAGAASTLDDNGIDVGGFVEASWTHNFNDPDNKTNEGRVFDFEHDDPTFNQLDIYVDKAVMASGDKFDLGGRMEWMWGGDARLIHANGSFDHYGVADGPDEQFDLVQLYLQANLPVGNGLIVTVGKFVTLLGYETINPTTNPLYSHSFGFGFAIPFTHTGIMAKYGINDNWSVTGAVVRGWEQAQEDNNDGVSWMGQIAYTQDKLNLYFNAITGPEQTDDEDNYRTVLDIVAVYQASDQLTLVANGDYGFEDEAGSGGDDAHWCGLALYGIYKIDNMFSLVGRAEYFNDDDGSRGIGDTVYSFTAGVNIHPMPDNEIGSGLVLRPEIRWDGSDSDTFDGGTDDSQVTFGIDAIFMF